MLLLKQQLQYLQTGLTEVASELGISKSAVAQLINHGQWPRRNTDRLRANIIALLQRHNVDTTHSFDEVSAPSPTLTPTPATGEETMLLKKQTLSQQAKKAFKLFQNPFDDTAVQCAEDVFTTPDIRY
ncbi:hypothetical protein PK12_004912, partial [Salmonella enterica subsp. enterica]|nr:hypothetical protein [Salmonella enterica subsp. enterica serovar Bonariensis]